MSNIISYDKLFRLDEHRDHLIKVGKRKELIDSYSIETETKNVNSPIFWKSKLEVNTTANDPMRDARINLACKFIGTQKQSLLNIGVGTGILEKKLNKLSKVDITGLDITQNGLKIALREARFLPVCGSVNDLPFQRKFDVITTLEVLEHLKYSEIFSALNGIKQVLKRNGLLIVSVPLSESYSNNFNPNGHMRRYSKQLILAELEIAGFTILKTKELYAFNKWYSIKTLIVNFFTSFLWKPNNIVIKCQKK